MARKIERQKNSNHQIPEIDDIFSSLNLYFDQKNEASKSKLSYRLIKAVRKIPINVYLFLFIFFFLLSISGLGIVFHSATNNGFLAKNNQILIILLYFFMILLLFSMIYFLVWDVVKTLQSTRSYKDELLEYKE